MRFLRIPQVPQASSLAVLLRNFQFVPRYAEASAERCLRKLLRDCVVVDHRTHYYYYFTLVYSTSYSSSNHPQVITGWSHSHWFRPFSGNCTALSYLDSQVPKVFHLLLLAFLHVLSLTCQCSQLGACASA